jgi:predicted transcriptional regulator YdeE
MEKYQIKEDINVFGFEVKTFPKGIGEAFEALVKLVPDGFGRPYYGICYTDSHNHIVYLATAIEKEPGEAEKFNCSRYTIAKGEYAVETVLDWRGKTDTIKHVFERMMKTIPNGPTGPIVEWYKNDWEMVCMIPLDQPK